MQVKHFIQSGVEVQCETYGKIAHLHFKKIGEPYSLKFLNGYGAYNEDQPGSVHFLEHMLVAGTEKYKTKKELSSLFDRKGYMYGAMTSHMMMQINGDYNGVEDIAFSFDMLDQFVFKSLFDHVSIENERSAIRKEIEMKQTEKGFARYYAFLSRLLPGHPSARDVKGTQETLAGITKINLLSTYQTFLNSKKVLISSGDFDISKFQGHVDMYAQKLSEYNNQLPQYVHASLLKGEHAFLHPLGFSGVGIFFERTMYADKKAHVIAQFLNNILFGKNGLCLEKIRYERGLTYGIDNMSQSNPVIDMWGVFVECGKENISHVRHILQHILFEEIYTHITQEKVTEFITKYTVRERRNFRTTDDFMRTYSMEFLYHGTDMLWHDDALVLLSQIPLSEIKEYVKKTYAPENQSTVIFE